MTWVTSISFWTGVVPSQTGAQQGLLVQVWSRAGKGGPGACWEAAAGGGPGEGAQEDHEQCMPGMSLSRQDAQSHNVLGELVKGKGLFPADFISHTPHLFSF